MTLLDRAAGALLGQACGDALGVPYEFGTPPGPGERAEMRGGGLIHGAPGEWSDDTAMAVGVAQAAATHDLSSPDGLSAVGRRFLAWFAADPPDVGIQTRAVLAAVSHDADRDDLGSLLTAAAESYAASHPHSAGNGALMRTAPLALASLDDRQRTATAARAVARLTHADPLAGDSCVLWSEAVRVAVTTGRLDVRAGLDLLPDTRRDDWAALLDRATTEPASTFRPNGFTVTALQAAVAAIGDGSSFEDGLHAAVRIGDDTDTVAAIAGGLLGALHGASAVPDEWRGLVHGWPGLRADDLEALAAEILRTHPPQG